MCRDSSSYEEIPDLLGSEAGRIRCANEDRPLRDPVFSYSNPEDTAAAVVCGYEYSGAAVDLFTDKFVFADFVPEGFGQLMTATQNDDGWEITHLQTPEKSKEYLWDKFVFGIEQDPNGELYLLTSSTDPRLETGGIYRITAP